MSEKRATTTDDAHRAKTRPPAAPQTAKTAPPAPHTLTRAVDPAELSAASPAQVRRLHRAIGNRALNRLLTRPTIQAKLTVGPADDRFEREADQAAAAVMRQAQTPAPALPSEEETALQRLPQPGPSVGLEGGDVNADVEARLSATRGAGQPLPDATRAQMETGLGADFDGVRIHTDAAAHDLNRELGAQAFTHGADVYMAPGKYAPGSSDGQRLLAHELTHVVQQGASTVRRRARRPAAAPLTETVADGVIHRKLSGTREALEALGGEASLKSKGKAMVSSIKAKVGKSTTGEGSGKYAQLLSGLKSYEKLEVKYAAQNRPFLTGKEKADLWGRLKELEVLTVAWLEENADEGVAPDVARQQVQNMEPEEIRGGETLEQQRYHALKLLLPRLRHEMLEINRDDFYRTNIYSDRRLNAEGTRDDAFGGAVNRLDLVSHRGEQGVFTQDKTWADAMTVGSTLGIPLADPNAGARSVAMYQLARLLNLGVEVIARTEFATHTSATNVANRPLAAPMAKLGVRQALATGTEAAETPTALTAADARARGGNTISLEDPTLQRSLNALQLIDAIAGQIDRHWHNYYIATDGEGRVDGVVGIDLDMAFAPDHRTVAPATNNNDDPLKGAHFVGMPALVDSQFAARLVAVQADDVAALLRNYLSAAEVAAAVERFNLVKEACRGILERHEAVLPGGWGADTARAQLSGLSAENTSYLGKMAAGTTKHAFSTPVTATVQARIRDAEGRRGMYAIIENLERLIWSSILTVAESTALSELLIANWEATPEGEQRALMQNLRNTPIRNWNNYLRHPAANPGVLLKTA
ncbi:MAG: DUF4157 domain-containing protein [Anaerolineales bacterium]|nr:DUF4157 domain-containing protein [Anaerolineales bacterium]